MNLVRGIGRLLLGGFFIVQGVKAVKDPAKFASAAEPIAQRIVPLAQKTLPPEASAYVPEDPETLVRINGTLSVLGGMGMATGIGRRPGAWLAATSMVPHLLAANPRGASPEKQHELRGLFLRNLALLGAALVVSQDTAGQPSLAWRAGDTRRRISREADRAKKSISKDAQHLKREAKLQARVARKSIEGALS